MPSNFIRSRDFNYFIRIHIMRESLKKFFLPHGKKSLYDLLLGVFILTAWIGFYIMYQNGVSACIHVTFFCIFLILGAYFGAQSLYIKNK